MLNKLCPIMDNEQHPETRCHNHKDDITNVSTCANFKELSIECIRVCDNFSPRPYRGQLNE